MMAIVVVVVVTANFVVIAVMLLFSCLFVDIIEYEVLFLLVMLPWLVSTLP